MDIFRFIENLSYSLGYKIALRFNEDEDGIEETQYGLFAVLSFLFEFGTGVIVSLIFGYFEYFLVFQIVYCFLRSVCGGEHCDTFASCWLVTNIISFVGSMLSILFSISDFYLAIGAFLFFIISIDMYYEIPKPSKNSPSRGEMDIKFRKRYVEGTCGLFLLLCFMIFFDIRFVPASMYSSYIMCFVMLSKFGDWFIKNVKI